MTKHNSRITARPQQVAETSAVPQDTLNATNSCKDRCERPAGESTEADGLFLKYWKKAEDGPKLNTAWPRSCEARGALTAEEKRRASCLLSGRTPNKRGVALHEAAHCAVAEYYGVGWQACIFRKPGSTSWTGEQSWAGKVEPSLFQRAVVAWAGSVVDFLRGWPLAEWPVVRRRAFEEVKVQEVRHFKKYHMVLFLAGIAAEKATGRPFRASCYGDLQNIQLARQKWRALKTSWSIVVRHRYEIANLAAILMKHEEAGSPEHWHAPTAPAREACLAWRRSWALTSLNGGPLTD